MPKLIQCPDKRKSYCSGCCYCDTDKKPSKWKGELVSYRVLHKWVRRHRPCPKACEKCGKEKKVLDCANISGKYKRDLTDWEYLCRKCHMEKDGRLEIFVRDMRGKYVKKQ